MEQPNLEEKKKLLELCKKEKVNIVGTKNSVNIGYMRGYTLEKLSSISLWIRENAGNLDKKSTNAKIKIAAKEVSYGVLNGMKIFFFHWFYWRWLYYIKGYNLSQLEPIIEVIKKKIPLADYSKAITLALLNDITVMKLSEEEQKAALQELSLEKEAKLEKNTDG